MDDVLWHSATCRFSKSILVKIPRLPTIRVIGSQFISTSLRVFPGASDVGAVMVLISQIPFSFDLVSSRMVASGQFRPRMPPLRFFVDRIVGDGAQRSNSTAIN